MIKFDKETFAGSLSSLPFPVAHTVFLEEQTAPYLIYTDNDFEFVSADSKTVLCRTAIVLELYTKAEQTDENEEVIENFLDDFTTYEKSRSYISEEQLYITYYTFEL
ncbi:MAG: hypothetical protein II440_03445 [Clostridia bacterium]|nr:hypothetical protein [Clostridia bacterium]